jgi:Protein DA1/LIM domain
MLCRTLDKLRSHCQISIIRHRLTHHRCRPARLSISLRSHSLIPHTTPPPQTYSSSHTRIPSLLFSSSVSVSLFRTQNRYYYRDSGSKPRSASSSAAASQSATSSNGNRPWKAPKWMQSISRRAWIVIGGILAIIGGNAIFQYVQRRRHDALLEQKLTPRYRTPFFDMECASCKQHLDEGQDFVVMYGRRWHREHACCRICGEHFSKTKLLTKNRSLYCIGHYAQVAQPRCIICGVKHSNRTGPSLFYSSIVCQRHLAALTANEDMLTRSRCYSCDEIVLRQSGSGFQFVGRQLNDGRSLCQGCFRHQVPSGTAVRKLVHEIALWMKHDLDLDIKYNIKNLRLAMLPLPTLRELPHGIFEGRALLTFRLRHIFPQAPTVSAVQLMQDLPYEHLGKIVAHELTHVMMHMHGMHRLPSEINEGMCELMAYLWLTAIERDPKYRRLATARLRLLENNRGTPYGTGFHAAMQALQGRTIHELLDYVMLHNRWPPLHVRERVNGK